MTKANLRIYYTWKNLKSAYNRNEFKMSALTKNDEFDLPGWSYSWNIQDYFEYINIIKWIKSKTGLFLK